MNLQRLRKMFQYLSFAPFDGSTVEGRSQERHRRVALSAGAAAAAKLLAVSVTLVSIPLTLHYLGTERFGMWMTISSVIAMLSFADFGMGNGILSAVAEANGNDDRVAIRRYVASGFFVLTGIAGLILLLFAAAYSFVPWYRIFNVNTELARSEAGPALAVFIVCFALNIPLGIVQRVQMGLQRGFTPSLWQCAGSVLALAGLLVVIKMEGSLPWLVLAVTGAPLLAATLNSLYFFGRTQRDLAPAWARVSRPAIRRIAGTGLLFFVLQIVVSVAYTSDNIVIAQLLGAAAVPEYSVPEKMFSLVSVALAMVLAPLWPAYGEAMARGDGVWVRKTLQRSLILAISFATVLSLILVLLGKQLLSLWMGHVVDPPLVLLLGLGVWKVVEAGGNALAVFLNGAKAVRLQVFAAIAMAICAVICKVIFVQFIGVSGVVWATTLSYLVFAAVPFAIFVPRMLRLPKK